VCQFSIRQDSLSLSFTTSIPIEEKMMGVQNDKKERWGHELFIEKVILNPEPEPPRIYTEIEIPQEKWISKAGGVAIFTNRPTSASSYQGRKDY